MHHIELNSAQLQSDLLAAWAIAKKDIRMYYLKPQTIMFGVMFPLAMFFSFALGKNVPPATLIPGLLAITIFFSSSSIGPTAIPTERRVKTFERLLSAPISYYSILLGKTLGGFLFGLVIAIIPLLIGTIWFEMQVIQPAVMAIGLGLSSLCFAALGIMFASYPTENPGDIMMMLNFVRLPLIFISGVFLPVESMPAWGQTAAVFSPLTYANDIIAFALQGKSHYGPILDSVVLLVFIGVFQAAGLLLARKFRE